MNKNLSDLAIEVQRNTESMTVPTDEQFSLWARTALAGRREQAELAIRIVDAAEAQQFNSQYRHRDYATNVLSFPAELPQGLPAEAAVYALGDLLMCAPLVADEAKQQGKRESDHWAHLTVHGVLHLLGYDHEQEPEAVVMEALETRVLDELGISNPYLDH